MSEIQKIQHPKIYARYLNLYRNDSKKDITFVFDNSSTKIKAHRLILETVSPVFETMFNGSFEEKDTALIRFTDPAIFQKLIDVVYMQPIQINSLEEADELCNIGEMYDIEDLKDLASSYMLENCTYKNCFNLLEKARLYNLDKVANQCRKLLSATFSEDLNFMEIFEQEKNIDEDTFCEFLSFNESPDSALYELLEYFIVTKKLKTYQKAIAQIRFLTMSIEEIVLVQYLTESEKLAIISCIEANKTGKKSIAEMPENISTNSKLREGHSSAKSFCYQYFWITMLLKFPLEHFDVQIKRVSALQQLFTTDQIEIIKNSYQKRKEAAEDCKEDDFKIIKHILRESKLLKWFDVIYHGKSQITIFGKELCGIKIVSLDFNLS